jgi:hypothetical protein
MLGAASGETTLPRGAARGMAKRPAPARGSKDQSRGARFRFLPSPASLWLPGPCSSPVYAPPRTMFAAINYSSLFGVYFC